MELVVGQLPENMATNKQLGEEKPYIYVCDAK